MRMKQRLLIVADDLFVLVPLKKHLSSLGFTVDCAHDVPSAEEWMGAEKHQAAVVLVGRSNGKEPEPYGALKAVRRKRPAVPLLALSWRCAPEFGDELRSNGADRVLVAPWTASQVAAGVLGLLVDRSNESLA